MRSKLLIMSTAALLAGTLAAASQNLQPGGAGGAAQEKGQQGSVKGSEAPKAGQMQREGQGGLKGKTQGQAERVEDNAKGKTQGQAERVEDNAKGKTQGQAERVEDNAKGKTPGPAERAQDNAKGKTQGQAERVEDKAKIQTQGQVDQDKAKGKGQAERDQDKSKQQTQGQNQRDPDRVQGREQDRAQGDRDRVQGREQDRAQGDRDRVQGGDRDRVQQGEREGRSSNTTVSFTTEQRTKIRETVFKERNAPRVSKVDFSLNVGTVVPRTVHIVEVPDVIVTVHPEWRGYRYFIVNDEIVVVEPDTLKIVAVIDV
jgi:hypothetical protein